MSIVGMVDNRVALEKRKTAVAAAAPEDRAAAAEPHPQGVPSNVVNQLVAYIPVEIITVWVALIAVLNNPKPPPGGKVSDADWSTHWIAAIICAVIASLLAYGLAYRKTKDTPGVEFKPPWFQMIAAPVAFMAWVISLPESPLQSASWYTVSAGAFIVTVSTVAITTMAYILGQAGRFSTT